MGGRGGRGDPTHSGFRVGAGDTREKLAGGLLFSRRAPRRRTRSGGGPRARARARSRVPRGRARARRRGAKARILAGRAVHARLNLSSLSGERMRPSAIARESEIEGGSADWCHEFSFPRRDSASAGRRRAAPVRGAGAACPRDRERRGSARSRDAGGGRPGASAGPVGVARGRARDGAFSRLERAERSERATGHCFGVPLPGADRSVRDFFPVFPSTRKTTASTRENES